MENKIIFILNGEKIVSWLYKIAHKIEKSRLWLLWSFLLIALGIAMTFIFVYPLSKAIVTGLSSTIFHFIPYMLLINFFGKWFVPLAILLSFYWYINIDPIGKKDKSRPESYLNYKPRFTMIFLAFIIMIIHETTSYKFMGFLNF